MYFFSMTALIYFSLRTNILNYTEKGMATDWITMKKSNYKTYRESYISMKLIIVIISYIDL